MPDDLDTYRRRDQLLGELSANVQRLLDGQEAMQGALQRHENGPHEKVDKILALYDKRLNAHSRNLAFIKGGAVVVGTGAATVWAAMKGYLTARW